jgi:hypothetical protein
MPCKGPEEYGVSHHHKAKEEAYLGDIKMKNLCIHTPQRDSSKDWLDLKLKVIEFKARKGTAVRVLPDYRILPH